VDSTLLNPRDLAFLLYEWLGVERLCERPRYADHSRETFGAALDLSARIAREHFEPINRLLDAREPTFDGERVDTPPELAAALKVFADAGLIAAEHGYEHGGMQLPVTVAKACFAWFDAACVAGVGYPFLTQGNANLLLAHGTEEQKARWVPHLLAGRFFGTMCLSEPQAGSSLSDIRTRAEPRGDGTYRLFGNKMWISGGEHELARNIVHLVLAKIPGPDGRLVPGTRGISLFLVPKRLLDEDGSVAERNDVALAGLNHKLGYRGTTNCLLNFGEGRWRPGGEAGAVGWLVGAPGQGLACMFHMMNEARIGVGLGAACLGYTGYLHALDYARNRPQGRHPQAKDPASPQVPIVEHADVRRMLLAQKAYAEGGLALCLYGARLVDDLQTGTETERDRAHWLLELLTPVIKSWPSQWCLEANSLAIQVHGGYGYTRDYDVEQFWRDNRLNPIHEGTHGIQGLDLLGRKMVSGEGKAAQRFAAEVDASVARAGALAAGVPGGTELAAMGRQLAEANARVLSTARRLHAVGDLNVTLANASAFLEAFGHVVVAWVWLEQATLAWAAVPTGAADDDFYAGKRQAARYFFRWELPKTTPMLDALDAIDTSALEMRDAWF
jgi:alkylation response protein AidB-like acyl-CoA dehydrogenase